MKNRILVAMFAFAFFAANASAGWVSIQLMMDAGPTAGNVTFLFLAIMFGSTWPDLFSKSIVRANSAGLLCLASYCLFLISAILSCWQIYMA
jgi:uncharacterized membrane protein (UPF0182 family)